MKKWWMLELTMKNSWYLIYFKHANIVPKQVGEKYKGSIDELRAKYCHKLPKATSEIIKATEFERNRRGIGFPETMVGKKSKRMLNMGEGTWGDFHPPDPSSIPGIPDKPKTPIDGVFLPEPVSEDVLHNSSNLYICDDFDDSLITKVIKPFFWFFFFTFWSLIFVFFLWNSAFKKFHLFFKIFFSILQTFPVPHNLTLWILAKIWWPI